MASGSVVAICICPKAGAPMRRVESVRAVAGQGLEGDRYIGGSGSWNKGKPGKRQVTLMNATFFPGTGFCFEDSRRNLFVEGVELMPFIGKEFQVGGVRMRGVKYCDPCTRPDKLSGKDGFREAFQYRGGLIAEILDDGEIEVGDDVIPPPKGY